ncbi:alpha/beta hydrolase [Magnetospirillum sp. ME-1]|uniref:alpha/beta hydrolase n=1 Tax=Magnetospirillum sp. ME-1 TaxID=1639348 RepID=UPI0011AE4FD5|nr:alpha/beta hydrolase [Magnetospirillum sp. ME-1]
MAVSFFSLLAACSSGPFAGRDEVARRLAAEKGLSGQILAGPTFPIQAFVAPARPAGLLTIYVEGDGLAWRNRFTPSADPTPRNPIGLGLAVADPSTAVAYLARPCQYVKSPACSVDAWTGGRFSDRAIEATNRAIDDLKRRHGTERILMVGYSGGGVMAALIAAGRPDVAGLITVAAPLDLAAWVRHHDVDPLANSRDPARCCSEALSRTRQRHVVGLRDDVVPRSVVASYGRTLSADAPFAVVAVDSDHECCYVDHWPGLVTRLRQDILGREAP